MVEARRDTITSEGVVGAGPNLHDEALEIWKGARTPSVNPVDHRGLHGDQSL